jgi:acyl-coenzyme A thioesterase PaaI-like protein
MATLGFEYHVEGNVGLGQATMHDYLRTAENWPSAGVLLTFADVLIGLLASHQTAPRISVTANLAVHMAGPLPEDGRLSLRGELSKVGRSMTVGETEVRSAASGDLVAIAIGTFLASPRPQDVSSPFHWVRPAGRVETTAATLSDHVGLRVLAPGVTEIALRPDLTNATESLQGGLVALLGEIAAQTAASAGIGETAVVDSLDVHYLAAARIGPFRAAARLLSPQLVRVEVRDPGRGDRIVAIVVARTRAADRPAERAERSARQGSAQMRHQPSIS